MIRSALSLLVAFAFPIFVGYAQDQDPLSEFDYDINDYFSFRNHTPPESFPQWASTWGYDHYARPSYKIVDKQQCDGCLIYAVEGVVNDVWVHWRDNKTWKVEEYFYPLKDTLYFCKDNPSFLEYFRDYLKWLRSPVHPITADEELYLSKGNQVSENSALVLTLNQMPIYEKMPEGTLVGTLSRVPDGIHFKQWYLHSTCEPDDNKYFRLVRDYLYAREPLPDFSEKSTYTIRLKTSNGFGAFREFTFNINVLDDEGNLPPSDLQLVNVSPETIPNFPVGTLRTFDPNGDTVSYSFAGGMDRLDNKNFYIRDSTVYRKNNPYTFGADSLTFAILVYDGINGFLEKEFTVKSGPSECPLPPSIFQQANRMRFAGETAGFTHADWYKNGKYYGSGSSAVIDDTTATYSVWLTFGTGCQTQSPNFAPDPKKMNEDPECDLHFTLYMADDLGLRTYYSTYQWGDPLHSYTWFRDGVQLANTSATILAEEPGTYYAAVHFENGCSFTSNPLIVSRFDCYTPTIIRDGMNLRSTFGDTFSWYLDGRQLQNTDRTITMISPGSYTVGVTYDATGCTKFSAPYIVYATEDDCLAPAISLYDGKLVSTMGDQYEWFRNGSAIQHSEQELELTGPEIAEYVVRVSYDNGCVKTSSPFTTDLCSHFPKPAAIGMYDRIATYPYDPSYGYFWTANGVRLGKDYERDEILTPEPGHYMVTVTYPGGCVKQSDSTLIYSAGKDCIAPVITSNGQQLSTTGAPSYAWFRNGELIPGEWEETLRITEPGYYKVLAAYTPACSRESEEYIVYYGSETCLEPDISQNGATLIAPFAATYEWYRDNKLVGDEQWLNAQLPAEFQLVVTYPNGCTASSDTRYFDEADSPDESAFAISLFPNPSDGEVTITSPLPDGPMLITIFKINGQVLHRQNWDPRDDNVLQLDLQKFLPGIYQIRFQQGTKSASKRIVRK